MSDPSDPRTPPDLSGRHIVFLSWRDTANPEGGGAELYLERMATGLVALGARVTIFCAAHAAAPPDETVDGVRYVRRGGKLGVYLRGMLALALRRFGRIDVVVDVQNGLPFFSRLVTRVPVVVLVHHVHREQWPVVYPGLTGRVGWWIERRFAPRLYRRCRYVAVSQATREELADLGVDPDRITVVHNGTDVVAGDRIGDAEQPTVAVVGRLVPHKQVEHAIDTALTLRGRWPDLRLVVVGTGWWEEELHAYAAHRDAGSTVVFLGHVDEVVKHEVYERAWVLALPSLKEGWGLVVGEAGAHGTPTVAFRSAGGTTESVTDQKSGLLVDTPAEFTGAIAEILADPVLRQRLGSGARARSRAFTWDHGRDEFAAVVADRLPGQTQPISPERSRTR